MSMKKMCIAIAFATAVTSAALAACHGKKPATAPSGDGASSPAAGSLEHKDDATGGATYGGRKPAKDAPSSPNH
jgi:hypothetical protein